MLIVVILIDEFYQIKSNEPIERFIIIGKLFLLYYFIGFSFFPYLFVNGLCIYFDSIG